MKLSFQNLFRSSSCQSATDAVPEISGSAKDLETPVSPLRRASFFQSLFKTQAASHSTIGEEHQQEGFSRYFRKSVPKTKVTVPLMLPNISNRNVLF
jgi:hypothetical protein